MKRIALIVGALVLTFAAGVAVGMRSVSIATSINPGLVNALNSVGQNLFGFDVFSAQIHPPDPTLPPDAVQMDVVAHPPDPNSVIVPIPKIVNIAISNHPPDPNLELDCQIGLQMVLDPNGGNPTAPAVTAIYDSTVLTPVPGRPIGRAFCERVRVDP